MRARLRRDGPAQGQRPGGVGDVQPPAERVVLVFLRGAKNIVVDAAELLDALAEPLPPSRQFDGAVRPERQGGIHGGLGECDVGIAPVARPCLGRAVALRRDAAFGGQMKNRGAERYVANHAANRCKEASRVEIGIGAPGACRLSEGERPGEGLGITGDAPSGEDRLDLAEPLRQHRRGAARAEAAGFQMREVPLRGLTRLEIDHASHGIGAIFDRCRALDHPHPAEQPGRQQAEIDPPVPWHGERSAVEEDLRLALVGTADARDRLTARIGPHRHPGDPAQHVGSAARLAIHQQIDRHRHLRRQGAGFPRRGGDDNRRPLLPRLRNLSGGARGDQSAAGKPRPGQQGAPFHSAAGIAAPGTHGAPAAASSASKAGIVPSTSAVTRSRKAAKSALA